MTQAIVFDVDGTLLDTNWVHVEAWRRAFADHGHDVPRVRIVPEIGKGGDQLLPSILGGEIEARDGDAIRGTQSRRFRAFMARVQLEVFPGALELLQDLRDRSVHIALATSSEREFLELMERRAGCDLQALADEVVTKSDADRSKPAPDLVEVAVQRLGVPAGQCLMIGDTPHDGEACRRAGVRFGAFLCGGSVRDELARSGAVHVWRDPTHMHRELDAVLSQASAARAAGEG